MLDDADLRAMLGATDVLTADPLPGFDAVLDMLRTLIACDSASFNDMALATSDFRYVIDPPGYAATAEKLKPAYDRSAHQHPLIAEAASTSTQGALRFCDVAGGESLTSTELYRSFYEPFDIRYQLVIQLPSPRDVVVGYALNRSASGGEFSDRDVAVLNALSGHLAMHHRSSMDRDRSRAFAAELDLGSWAVVSVRSDGVIEASSSATLRRGTRVPPELADLLAAEAGPGSDATSHDLVFHDGTWRCVVHPVPLGPTVVLMRPSTTGSEIARLIEAGLTPRQAEVGRELVRTGASNAQLAVELGMSEGTVKKHLEMMFRVLDVTSRSEAAVALRALVA